LRHRNKPRPDAVLMISVRCKSCRPAELYSSTELVFNASLNHADRFAKNVVFLGFGRLSCYCRLNPDSSIFLCLQGFSPTRRLGSRRAAM
jgi:hypothetical protein